MKVGDKVQVIKRPTECNGNENCECYVGEIGTIRSINDTNGQIWVNPFDRKPSGCSAFHKEHLAPAPRKLKMKVGRYVRLIEKTGMNAKIGAIARIKKEPYSYVYHDSERCSLIDVEWKDPMHTGLRRGQFEGGYNVKHFEVLDMKVLAEVYSKTNPDKKYEIRLGKDGVTYCTCWAWKKSRTCKHLDGFFAHLESMKPDVCKPIEPKTELEVLVSQAVKEAVQCLK